MHHFLYSTQDSYIDNRSDFRDKNFGLDELLVVGVTHSFSRILNTTKTYTYSNSYVSGMSVDDFTGILTGSFSGNIENSNGILVGTTNKFSASYFSGSLTASVSGFETGSSLITNSGFSGSLLGFSGSISSSVISGNISGSIISACFSTFTGKISGSDGNVTGYISGTEIRNEDNYTVIDKSFKDRALIKFDLTAISNSIVSGDIVSPQFYLKLNSVMEQELPISYKIYTFPVSQSWSMGDGYWADGGTDTGVSWDYKDYTSGSVWYSPYVTTILTQSIDYLENYFYAPESFKRGGGTWYSGSCTQSFNHDAADLNINVTSIVNRWLSGSIPNEGFILMCSKETSLTASNANISFFSNDTNTIYSPKLDVAWDDSSWITGSLSTSSVIITTYNPGIISGSVYSGSNISNITVTGSFGGNSYINYNSNGTILNGLVDLVGTSLTVNNVAIIGNITGSTITLSGPVFVTASLLDGLHSGSILYGEYNSSILTGKITGSYINELFLSNTISGSVNNILSYISITGLYTGSGVGTFNANGVNSGSFTGVITEGNLQGANVFIPITGSYTYLTSSVSVTSSVEITGTSLVPISSSIPFLVTVQNLKKEYSFGDVPRINIYAKEQFSLKTFEKNFQQPVHTTPKYLPTSSYYAIKDNETEEIIVDFDNYTKISCDTSGNYLYLDTTGLSQERYYKLLIKVICDTGTTYTFDSNDVFKIRR